MLTAPAPARLLLLLLHHCRCCYRRTEPKMASLSGLPTPPPRQRVPHPSPPPLNQSHRFPRLFFRGLPASMSQHQNYCGGNVALRESREIRGGAAQRLVLRPVKDPCAGAELALLRLAPHPSLTGRSCTAPWEKRQGPAVCLTDSSLTERAAIVRIPLRARKNNRPNSLEYQLAEDPPTLPPLTFCQTGLHLSTSSPHSRTNL